MGPFKNHQARASRYILQRWPKNIFLWTLCLDLELLCVYTHNNDKQSFHSLEPINANCVLEHQQKRNTYSKSPRTNDMIILFKWGESNTLKLLLILLFQPTMIDKEGVSVHDPVNCIILLSLQLLSHGNGIEVLTVTKYLPSFIQVP